MYIFISTHLNTCINVCLYIFMYIYIGLGRALRADEHSQKHILIFRPELCATDERSTFAVGFGIGFIQKVYICICIHDVYACLYSEDKHALSYMYVYI
jgi:hypothetical protein